MARVSECRLHQAKAALEQDRPRAVAVLIFSNASEVVHAAHSNRQTARNTDHSYRVRAGEAGRGFVVDDRAGPFHVAATRIRVHQPAPQPGWAAHRQLHSMAESGSVAIGA